MLKSQRHVFWEALFVTFLIFGLGVFLGVVLENLRSEKISDLYTQSELTLLDIKVQTQILNLDDLNCGEAIKKNIEFGDLIYEDVKKLEKYEKASKLTEYIVNEHKRYDLLRTLFWINSIKIKEKCGNEFQTLVFLYDYNSKDLGEKNKQEVFSRFLMEIKHLYGNEIILIPIAKDTGLLSIELLIKNYNINETSIILNEKHVFTKLDDLKELEEMLNQSQSN